MPTALNAFYVEPGVEKDVTFRADLPREDGMHDARHRCAGRVSMPLIQVCPGCSD